MGSYKSFYALTLTQYLTNHDKAQRIEHLVRLLKIIDEDEDEKQSLCTIERKIKVARVFSRVCDNDKETKELTLRLVSEICECGLEKTEVNWNARMEVARHLRDLGRYKEAMYQYELATNIDQGDMDTLQGMVLCLVLGGSMEEATQQIEFVELLKV